MILSKDLEYIFVHGLSGWGSYDEQYIKMPYWGMRGGDLIPYLRNRGYRSYAASVAPAGSAWDRACELYAQLAGKRVDYGKAHSEKYGHARFGRDFSGCPLIPAWSEKTELVLLGHSFGGATVRLFSELMANGDEEERTASSGEDISPLFQGGMEKMIHSIVTLASPMNGTTAYDMFEDPDFDPGSVKVPWWSRKAADLMSRGTRRGADARDPKDSAAFDMHIDNAYAMNGRITTLPGTYYFFSPCAYSVKRKDGTHVPKGDMEPLFAMRSYQIGAYKGKTAGGIVLDEEWRENDGLVNTISAMVPSGAPSKKLDRNNIEKGKWNVFPTVDGDHMFLQGGLIHKHYIRELYLDILSLISPLY